MFWKGSLSLSPIQSCGSVKRLEELWDTEEGNWARSHYGQLGSSKDPICAQVGPRNGTILKYICRNHLGLKYNPQVILQIRGTIFLGTWSKFYTLSIIASFLPCSLLFFLLLFLFFVLFFFLVPLLRLIPLLLC